MATWDASHPKLAGLRKLDPAALSVSARDHPWLSPEYLSFLREVGWGSIGWLQLYGGAIDPDELMLRGHPAGFVVIGDDGAGEFYGFTPIQPQMVLAFDGADPRVLYPVGEFAEWVGGLLGE